MKNNTKLIMETWRRFLVEGPDGIDEELPGEPPFENEEPLSGDKDLEDRFADHESEYYPEDIQSRDPSQAYGKDEYSDLPPDYEHSYNDDDDYFDGQGTSINDFEEDDDDSSEYVTDEDTFGGMNSDEFYDYSDDSGEY